MGFNPDKNVTFLNSIVENIPNMVFLKDAEELRFVLFNKAGEDLLGYRREDLIGKNDYDFFPKEEADFFTQKDRLVLAGKKLIIIPEESIQTNHGPRILRTKKIPILDADGEPRYLLGISEDITEQQKKDAALKAALSRAEEGSRAKAVFLANMSHEIRTPMNGITGMIELLATTELTPEQREYAVTAQNCCDMLLSLMNDILDYSKMETGKMELDAVVFDIRDLVDGVTHISREKARRKGLELYVLVDHRVPCRMRGDKKRLMQVLVNLIDNAVKFTAKGRVQLALTPDEHNPASICFTVTDTGSGISPEMQVRITEPFLQVDDSTRRDQGGSGLGLSLVHQILNLAHSRLEIESGPDQGAILRFRLPVNLPIEESQCPPLLQQTGVLVVGAGPMTHGLVEALKAYGAPYQRIADPESVEKTLQHFPAQFVCYETDAQPDALALPPGCTPLALSPQTSGQDRPRCPLLFKELVHRLTATTATPQAAPDALTGSAKRALIVEDNPVNRRVLSRFLEKRGLAYDTAENGRIALDLCFKHTYDVILMDLQMPVLDGFETTRALRGVAAYANTPIIAVTANATDDYREACRACGMNDFLVKPVTKKQIDDTLDRYLD